MLIRVTEHMRNSTRFASSFSALAAVSRVSLGLVLGLAPSCALDDNLDAPGANDESIATAELSSDDTSEAICTKGRFRCHARVRTTSDGARITSHATAVAPPLGFGPTQLQSAYGVNVAKPPATAPTVAVVDAYGYAALESDLGVYRSTYGLPACTVANGCLKIVNQDGAVTPLPSAPPPDDDWTVETALDVDMVSAVCPSCKILVVQADDTSGNGLLFAQNAAVTLGASVISDSWGGPEAAPPNDPADAEVYFMHAGIATFVSAGDDGYNDQLSTTGTGPDYPGTSAYVIAVGGTHLIKDTSTRGWHETTWAPVAGNAKRGAGGSACSLSIPKPAYQTASPCAFKATTDIAAVGDPATGLAVYNAANQGWIVLGGTSAAAPMVAAIFAASGLGATATGAYVAANAAKLNDVTSGTNGTCGTDTLLCNAAVGWDGPTGFGTPNAALLAPVATTTGTGGASDGSSGDSSGNANDVSGGCAVGGGGSGLGAGVLLALLAVRRRHRARSAAATN
jgi:hypothetical protein